jgi:hypothetical protein
MTNGDPPVPAAQVLETLKMREGMLEKFYHMEDVKVTEMAHEDWKINLICETTSVQVTTFKSEPLMRRVNWRAKKD